MRKVGLENLILTGRKEEQGNAADGLEQIDGRTGFGRDSKKTKLIKGYKKQEDVEGHDCLRPEGIHHIKEI